MKALQLKGLWFLPEKPEDQCPGEITFSHSNGIILQLLGSFVDARTHSHEPEIINGIAADGSKVTLVSCYRIGASFNSASFETCTYDAQFAFTGRLFSTKEALKFIHIRATLSDLGRWIGERGFSFPASEKDEYLTKYELPEPTVYKAGEDVEITFRYFFYRNVTEWMKVTMEETCSVVVTVAEEKTFDYLLDQFQSIHRLLTLAYFQRPLVEELQVGIKKTIDDHEYFDECEVYYQTDTTDANYTPKRSSKFFLFTHKEVKASFSKILEKWLQSEKEMQPTLAGLTEAFMRRDSTAEFMFLNLAQSLETFHRRTHDDDQRKSPEFLQMLDDILSSAPATYRNWLKVKLEYAHEPSLKARLMELTDMVPVILHPFLFTPSTSKFINTVRDTRNYYTHYNPRLKSRTEKGETLFILSERMKLFLVCLMLKQLGFSDDEVVRIIFRKGVFLFNHIIKHNEVKKVFTDW